MLLCCTRTRIIASQLCRRRATVKKDKLPKAPTQEEVDQANAKMASFFAVLPALLKAVVSSVICYPIFKGLLSYSSDQQIRWAAYATLAVWIGFLVSALIDVFRLWKQRQKDPS